MMVTVATEGKTACVVIASALRQEGMGAWGNTESIKMCLSGWGQWEGKGAHRECRVRPLHPIHLSRGSHL